MRFTAVIGQLLLAASLALGFTLPAQAQITAGKEYLLVKPPQPTDSGNKVEVMEFFWYGCPHCFTLEPLIAAWTKTLAPDIYFRQLPFAFIGPPEHQKLFYALEELGQREALQRRIFNAIHVDRQRINTEAEITNFVVANGVDRAKFADAWKSFGVNTKLSRGKQLSNAYKIDGVPAIGIQGRYYTSATLAGSHEKALAVTNYLIDRARKA